MAAPTRPLFENLEDDEAQRAARRRRPVPAASVRVAAGEAAPQWTANLQIERLLVIVMFACVAWALGQSLLELGLPTGRVAAVALLATFVYASGIALGGRSAGRNMRRYVEYGISDWLLLLAPIILLLKLLPALFRGWRAVADEVASWTLHPGQFWDVGLVWSLLLVFFVWDESLREAEDLTNLSLQPGEIPPAPNSAEYSEWASTPYRFVDHSGAGRRLMRRFIGGGFLLLFLTGLAVTPASLLTNPDRPEVHSFFGHVLLYFLSGMVLAGQTSLDVQRTGWLRSGAAVQPGLARRWLAYGGALMALALALSFLFPTSFSDQAADQLPIIWRWLWLFHVPLGWLLGGLDWLIRHLAAVLVAPFVWLLPRGANEVVQPGAAPLPPAEQVEPIARAYPSLASRLAWSLLLYVLPGALAAYAIWNTWRKRQEIWIGLRGFGRDVWALLRGALLELATALWRLLTFGSPRLLAFAPAAIRARLAQGRAAGRAAGEPGWMRLRGLAPRALIQYFYVSVARRASAVGWERGRGQTPFEYSRALSERLPERREEVAALTEAFVRAKYSPAPVGQDDVRTARRPWQHVRDALQTRRRARQFGQWLGLGRE